MQQVELLMPVFLAQIGEINLLELMKALKEKHFSEVRKWVTQNGDNDPVRIFRKIYDGIHEHLKDTSIPQAILIIAEYQYKSAFVADQEINYGRLSHRDDGGLRV